MAEDENTEKTEALVMQAVNLLSIKTGLLDSWKRYSWLFERVLRPDEKILVGVRQSYLGSLAPGFVLATNKRIVVIKPSFWGLYFKINLTNSSKISYYQYNSITSTEFRRGFLLCSLVALVGDVTVNINDLRYSEDRSLTDLIEKVIELRG